VPEEMGKVMLSAFWRISGKLKPTSPKQVANKPSSTPRTKLRPAAWEGGSREHYEEGQSKKALAMKLKLEHKES